jgi:phosphoribosylglycinamide formyltransferase 1
MKRRVAILISGRGSNMAALIDAANAADFPAEIVAVISNRADAAGLEKAEASGIATLVIESKPFGKDRTGFEAVLQRALDENKVDLICLGGFMRLFTAEFVQRWYGRMLNIHPSLLPSFPGLDPHGQALQAVADGDTPETLSQRILGIEHRIYPEALRLLASGKLRLEGDICKVDDSTDRDGTLISPRTI